MTHKALRMLALGFLIGCGGTPASATPDGGTPPDAAAGNPLLGSWFAQVTSVATDNQTVTLTFATGGGYSLVHTQTNAATSSEHAGCVETITDVGEYSSS